jgi:hypothetical protein
MNSENPAAVPKKEVSVKTLIGFTAAKLVSFSYMAGAIGSTDKIIPMLFWAGPLWGMANWILNDVMEIADAMLKERSK